MKCSTIGCKEEAGPVVVQWPDYPDEPVCDDCARFYKRLQSSADYSVAEVTR